MSSVTIPSSNKYRLVEVCDSGNVSKGIIVCNDVTLNDDMAFLYNAKIRSRVSSEDPKPALYPDCSSYARIPDKIVVSYAEDYPMLVIKRSIIINIYCVDNMNDWPLTEEWSSRNKEEAVAVCRDKLIELNAKIKNENALWLPNVIEDYRREKIREMGGKKYDSIGVIKKLLSKSCSRREFIDRYASTGDHRVDMIPLWKHIESKGFELPLDAKTKLEDSING